MNYWMKADLKPSNVVKQNLTVRYLSLISSGPFY